MKEIVMPKLGFDMEEGTISSWLVSIGDKVTEGDVIAEIETAKATVEVQAFVSGTLTSIMAEPGDVVPIGQVIAILDGYGQQITASTEETKEKETQTHVVSVPTDDEKISEDIPTERLMSPLAKRMIREMGLDVTKIIGTGPGGLITKDDVLNFKPMPSEEKQESIQSNKTVETSYQSVALSEHKKLVGKRMLQSTTTIPQFSVTTSIDMTRPVTIRKKQKENTSLITYSMNDFIIKAAAMALVKVPLLNSMLDGDQLKVFDYVDIGVAVARTDGLITVKVRNADKKTLREINTNMSDLITRANAGSLKPHELMNSTFTVSNLGMFGVESFSAIINPPEAAILSVGGIYVNPVYKNDQWIPCPFLKATLVVDHRIGDGVDAAKFLASFKEYLENISLDGEE